MKNKVVDLIEKTRIKENLSKTAMAEKLGMSQSVYSRKVSGEYSFNLDDLRNLVILFHPDVEDVKEVIGY